MGCNKLTPNQAKVMDIVIECSQESQSKGPIFNLQQIYLKAKLAKMSRDSIVTILDCILSKGYIKLIGPDTYKIVTCEYKLVGQD